MRGVVLVRLFLNLSALAHPDKFRNPRSAGDSFNSVPGMKRPPTYPAERAYPCCLPALGEFGVMPPHGGLRMSVGEGFVAHQSNGLRGQAAARSHA